MCICDVLDRFCDSLQGLLVGCRAISIQHKDAMCQDILNGAVVEGHRQLFSESRVAFVPFYPVARHLLSM